MERELDGGQSRPRGDAPQRARRHDPLRSNLFARRSGSISDSEAFRLAEVTPNQLRQLTDTSRRIAK